jgi:hypothetical protein
MGTKRAFFALFFPTRPFFCPPYLALFLSIPVISVLYFSLFPEKERIDIAAHREEGMEKKAFLYNHDACR